MELIIEEINLTANYQLSFRESSSTMDQVYRITDVTQKFAKAYLQGRLIHELNMLFTQISDICIYFKLKQNAAHTELNKIERDVPQENVLGPILQQDKISAFVNDVAVLAVGKNHKEDVIKLQTPINHIT